MPTAFNRTRYRLRVEIIKAQMEATKIYSNGGGKHEETVRMWAGAILSYTHITLYMASKYYQFE